MTWLIDSFCAESLSENSEILEVVQNLATRPDVKMVILDRGAWTSGGKSVPFPRYDAEHNCVADSILLQKMCDLYKVDIFMSLGWSMPLWTPSIYVDVQPELTSQRATVEQRLARMYARYILCPQADGQDTHLSPNSVANDARERGIVLSETAELTHLLRALGGRLCAEVADGRHEAFFQAWSKLRLMQAEVDYS